jgi:hypothetical protein
LIRQLSQLTQPVPAAGPDALALAVYAEVRPGGFERRVAAEQGFEGVACVDDAARAAVLYCQIWRQKRFPWARTAAEGLLRFVAFMQDEDGRFANFILGWDGQKNLLGSSSVPGGWPWQTRAMHALAHGVAAFGRAEYVEHFERGLPWIEQPSPYLDTRAVCVLAALEYWAATGAGAIAERAVAWAEEIAANRLGDLLPDAPGQADIHLWGHLQEAALAQAGQAFGRSDLVRRARVSAELVFVPRVGQAFEAHQTLPFEVSSAVQGLAAVAQASGEPRYAEQARLAREWFNGRNAAQRPIYDRKRGLVYDGIDAGHISENSGAESNIEGALALLDSLPWGEY